MRRNYLFTLFTIICTCLNAIPAAAQAKTQKTAKPVAVKIKAVGDPSESFAGAKKGDGIFEAQVTKMNGGDEDMANALAAQSVFFYDQLREKTAEQMTAAIEKAREAGKKQYEQLKTKRGTVKPAPVKSPARGKTATVKYDGAAPDSKHIFQNASFAPAEGDSPITRTETENGIKLTASEIKTVETPESTATRTASGDSDMTFDGKQLTVKMTMNDKLEAVSKSNGHKVTKEMKLEWKTSFDMCPDAEGIVRGTATARNFFQTTIHTGRELGALTTDTVTELTITGYVNDDAQMTHFDLEGTATETTYGYDRALDRGIVDDTKGIVDGKGSFIIHISNSTPPTREKAAPGGWDKDIELKLGEVRVETADQLSEGQVNRLDKLTGSNMGMLMMDLNGLMRASIARWQNQECVDVECVAPKQSLKPGEAVEVTATSVSKQDMSKINAPSMKAGGTESVTPEEQAGTPSAVYTLSAPKEGKATFVVTSTSRRGIGIGLLEIPVVKPKKPVKPAPPKLQKPKDPIWQGTVKAEHTDYEVLEGLPSARMTRDHYSKDEKWEVSLSIPGTRDLSGGVINNFHTTTEVVYKGVDYKEKVYVPGKMGCGRNGPIIMSGQTQRFSIVDKGTGKAEMLVTIAIFNGRGHISFGAPESIAQRHIITKYETACAEYNRANSYDGVEPQPVMVGSPSFEVNFDLDPTKPDQVSGTKTVLNDDGSKTIYTWNLSRVK